MTKDDIIRMARESNLMSVKFSTALEEMWVGQLERFAELVAAAERKDEREKVAQWMIQRSYATGHGDTTEDLLAELEWQVREAERNNMVATAAELGWALYGGDPFEDGVRDVAAIRARREQ